MPHLAIPADTYEKLVRRAAAMNVTVEQLIIPALERVAGAEVKNGHAPIPPGELPYDQWKDRFDELLTIVRSRAGRYPPGFHADVSRESIYEGCGE
ncbi:MAG TPA: hypothetical protein VMS17_04780 [Gemmataceae bacterium]|nr:hypothetical protein [Gemmataceae bacterium]